jgi:ferredoxin/coenzyme F420-reducing hydrogenase delta subunit
MSCPAVKGEGGADRPKDGLSSNPGPREGSQTGSEEAGVPATQVDPPARGAGLLRLLERSFLYLDRLLGRFLPVPLNPLMQTGAAAITAVIVATVTGIVLLIWYRPSVHLAYASVAAMSDAPWTAGLLRSLHRYSSDACMFFALVHALRLFLERRFAGTRWLAWITGIAMLMILWFVGWTGYWLVWDQRAQHVAVGTARLLDVVPIFTDPMGRSFLTDSGISSFLFFVVFFLHMLIPLGLALGGWLHLARLSRPHFLTRTPMTLWVLGSLLLLSLAYPAENAAPARMTELGQSFSMDWWYLLPLVFTDRLGGGALWALLLIGGALALSVPWTLGRGRARTAQVNASRCNACMQCYQDCPYHAISMVARSDGRERYLAQAEVDPAHCVGCGICAGSCDSVGIGLSWFGVADQRRRLEAWVQEALAAGETPTLALICADSAGAKLSVDSGSGICAELPGYRVLQLPCAGWVHPLTLERALRRGARGAIVVTCGPGACHYREGSRWVRERLDGERAPTLRDDKVERDRILVLPLDRTRKRELLRHAQAFQGGAGGSTEARPSRALAGLAAAVLAAIVAGGVGAVSDLGYAAPTVDGSELVVTFKHAGQVSENCREFSEEEKAQRPAHMRRDRICDRERASVRMRVRVDGERLHQASYPPTGIWGDGNSSAVERIPLPPGDHRIQIAIGDSTDPQEWSYQMDEVLRFSSDARRVLIFDRRSGFNWH